MRNGVQPLMNFKVLVELNLHVWQQAKTPEQAYHLARLNLSKADVKTMEGLVFECEERVEAWVLDENEQAIFDEDDARKKQQYQEEGEGQIGQNLSEDVPK